MNSVPRDFPTFGTVERFAQAGAFVASIPPGISSESELFNVLAASLRWPAYVGSNWNALYDCLGTLWWLTERTIVIAHTDIPQIGREGARLYLQVLRDSVADWNPGDPHELIVLFPLRVASDIASILSDVA